MGLRANDLISVQICGGECSFEWQSKNKIIARTGINGVKGIIISSGSFDCHLKKTHLSYYYYYFKGKGDVIVTTNSGGK